MKNYEMQYQRNKDALAKKGRSKLNLRSDFSLNSETRKSASPPKQFKKYDSVRQMKPNLTMMHFKKHNMNMINDKGGMANPGDRDAVNNLPLQYRFSILNDN